MRILTQIPKSDAANIPATTHFLTRYIDDGVEIISLVPTDYWNAGVLYSHLDSVDNYNTYELTQQEINDFYI